MPKDPLHLPEHESGLRRLVADAAGVPYAALRSLKEAAALDEGVVILEGDDGGQIYVVARAKHVRCSEQELATLLSDIDRLEWDDPTAARIFYERHPIGAPISGGMGGAVVEHAVWTHPSLSVPPVDILAVLAGERARISTHAV